MAHSPFSKIGPELIEDQRIKFAHLRVYWMLASVVPKGKDACRMGTRKIAERTKISQRSVCRRIGELIAWGHVELLDTRKGDRSHYRLTSIAFQIKPKEQPQRGYKPARKQPMTVRAAARALVDTAAARDEVLGA
jgi:hypothetical protein